MVRSCYSQRAEMEEILITLEKHISTLSIAENGTADGEWGVYLVWFWKISLCPFAHFVGRYYSNTPS